MNIDLCIGKDSMMYKINASDVASLLGKNKYKSRDDVFEQIAIEHNLNESEESTLSNEVESILSNEINNVLASTSARDTEERMQVYEKKTEELIVSDIVRRTMSLQPIFSSSVTVPEHIQSTITDICKKSATPETALAIAVKSPTIQTFLKQSKQVVDSVKSINTVRGQRLEERSTDTYQSTSGTNVTSRNSKCYIYSKNCWKIAGRVDGLTNDAVVETKTRRRFWNAPPEYDIVQLRCYMKLCNKQHGILNEQFPDNTSRTTRIEWDDSIWKSIEDGIDIAMLEFKKKYNLLL